MLLLMMLVLLIPKLLPLPMLFATHSRQQRTPH
jgi:hypothetical protein